MALFSIKNLICQFKAKTNNSNDIEGNNNQTTINNCPNITLQKCFKILSVLVAIGCLAGYITSVYYIAELYFQYNTVVSTEYVKFDYLPLPAVTACVPFAISYSQLCRKLNFTDQSECYQYMKGTYHISSLDDFVTSLSPEGEMGLVQSYHTDQYLTSGPAMRLIDFSFFRTAKLNCVAATDKVKTSHAGLDYFSKSNCYNFSQVFSLIYNNKKIGRSAQLCETFFSQYDPGYDEAKFTIDLKLNSNKMAFFKFELLSSWFPPGHKPEGLSLSLHPPNLIPSDLDFKFFNLKANKSYQIEYKRAVSILLPPPYKTMCVHYNSSETRSISRVDCIRRCVFFMSWDRKLQCRNQWNVILLNELNWNETLCQFDDSKDEQYYQIREKCENSCRKNCVNINYDVSIEVIDENYELFNQYGTDSDSDDTGGSTAFANLNDVTIAHHTGSEFIITHSADNTFSEFMADIGGLGGVYLGLSIFAIYNYFMTFLRKIRKLFSFASHDESANETKMQTESVECVVVVDKNNRQFKMDLDLMSVEKYDH